MIILSIERKEMFSILSINVVLHIFISSAVFILLKESSIECNDSHLAVTDGIPFISPETHREKYDLGYAHNTT